MMTGTQPLAAQPSTAIDPAAFNAFEAAGWERKAATYDDFVGGVTSRLVDRLLDAAGVVPGTRVLDIATGPGYAAAEAAGRGALVVGIDVAAAMVQLARGRYPGIDFRVADAEALPFEAGAFDAVVGNFMILHLARPEQAVSEFVRVLKPGGRVALSAWDQPIRMRMLGVFLDALADAGVSPPDDIPAGPPFFRFADEDQFAGLLEDAGLTGVTVDTIAFRHHVSTAAELWTGLLRGTVRTSALIERQTEQIRRQVRAAFDRQMRDYQRGDGFELPVSVKLAHGHAATRP